MSEYLKCHLEVEPRRFTDLKVLHEHLEAFVQKGARGWICWTDKVSSVPSTQSPEKPWWRKQPPIELELSHKEGRNLESLQCLFDGEGWLLTHLKRSPGESHLYREEFYQAINPEDPSTEQIVRYEIYWPTVESLDERFQSLRGEVCPQIGPIASAFAGFDSPD